MSNECVSLHPASALEAWQRVVPFTTEDRDYVGEWKNEHAYQGLNHARRKKGSIVRDPSVQHPASIRERYSIDRFLDTFPDEKSADDAACIRVHDEHLDKKTRNAINTKCGTFKDCYTLNENGEFEAAADKAKRVFKKDKKGQVVRGYCMNTATVHVNNLKNKSNFSEELQLTVEALETELHKTQSIVNKC